MNKKWSRTPKHIMRRACIKYIIKKWKPSSFIEFGAGTGDVTSIFLDKGYSGVCYDLGKENRNILRDNLSVYSGQVDVVDEVESQGQNKYDYLFAFEVLEHIGDDAQVLSEWTKYLKKGGKVLISVPAHMSKYSKDDEFVGHVRRYEKDELSHLLEKAGYKDIEILNHGFPLGNFTRLIAGILHKLKGGDNDLTPEERSIKSGVERVGLANKVSFLFNDVSMAPFLLLQKLFYRKDLGDGFVAYATKL